MLVVARPRLRCTVRAHAIPAADDGNGVAKEAAFRQTVVDQRPDGFQHLFYGERSRDADLQNECNGAAKAADKVGHDGQQRDPNHHGQYSGQDRFFGRGRLRCANGVDLLRDSHAAQLGGESGAHPSTDQQCREDGAVTERCPNRPVFRYRAMRRTAPDRQRTGWQRYSSENRCQQGDGP